MQTKRFLIFPLMVICLGLALFASLTTVFLSLSRIKKVDSNVNLSTESFSIYILEIASSSVESEAVQLGRDSMINGNAGYVWKGDKFYVVSSCYLNENDAVLMKKKRAKDDLYSGIIKETFPSVSISSAYSDKEKEVLLKALGSFYDTFEKLFDISVSLDGKHLNETSAILKINEIESNINAIESNFETLFEDSDIQFLKTINTSLKELGKTIDLLSKKSYVTPLQTLSAAVKYRYTETLHLYKELLGNLIEEK